MFQGGSLAARGDSYALLDVTAAVPQVKILNSSFVLQYGFALPPSKEADGYIGITFFGESIAVLQRKGTFCNDGKIAVAELTTFAPRTGALVDSDELTSYDNISLLGGVCETPAGLVFPGEFGGGKSFYRVEAEGAVEKVAPFTATVAVDYITSLCTDGTHLFLLDGDVDGQGRKRALAFDARAMTPVVSESVKFQADNSSPVGIDWNGSALVVLDNQTPPKIFLYGSDTPSGNVPSWSPQVGTEPQLLIWDDELEAFNGGAFKGLFLQEVKRLPEYDDTGILRFVDVERVTILPEYPILNAEIGGLFRRDCDGSSYRVKGINAFGQNVVQSFACERA